MHYTIEALLTGQPVAEWYQTAKKHWQDVLMTVDPTNPEAVAHLASNEQMWFEHNCGGRWIGQEIMVVVGVGQYYSTAAGFDENLDKAKAMYRALLGSGCSVEVHGHVEDMAKSYEELAEHPAR